VRTSMKFHYLVGASSSIWSFGLYRVSWEQQAGNDVDGKGGWARRSCVVGTHRRIGNPPPGVPPFFHESKGKVCTRKYQIREKDLRTQQPATIARAESACLPGDDAHDGAIRIFGVIRVLSDKRRLGNAAFATRR
jgi:hypothetical protein